MSRRVKAGLLDTYSQCTRAGPPCALAQGCQKESNAGRPARKGASETEGGLEEGRCAAECAFCVLLCSFETRPMKKQSHQQSNNDKTLSVCGSLRYKNEIAV